MTKVILAITGGGIRGIAGAQFLKRLEQATNKRIYDLFDMYAGTSVGAIIVSAIAYGKYSGTQLVDELLSPPNAQTIMHKSILDKIFGQLQLRPMYGDRGKLTVMRKYLDPNLLLHQTNKKVLLTAYNVNTYKPTFFKSWEPKYRNVPVVQAANMSSAAPSYFPSANISYTPHKSFWGVDGAMCTNDPCDSAYADALKLYGEGEDIRILSIGTGMGKPPQLGRETRLWGAIQWVTRGDLLGMLMGGPETATDYRMQQFSKALGHSYIRVDGPIKNMALDDVSDENINILKQIGDVWWDRYGPSVVQMLSKR